MFIKKFSKFDIINKEDDDDKDKDLKAQLDAMQEQIKAMSGSNEDLMKANKGLLKDLQGERSNRQQFQTRFESLSGTVQSILDKKKEDPVKDPDPAPATVDGLKVEIDSDGNAYVPTKALEGITGQYTEAINGLKADNEKLTNVIKQMSGSQQVQDAFKQTVAAVVGEKAEYSAAHSKLENLRSVVNKAVSDYQAQQGLEGFFTPAQVLDLLDGDLKDFGDEFTEVNPGVDIERIVRGYESQRDLRSTLSHISGLGAEKKEETDNQSTVGEQFKKVLSKPGTLANTSNQKDTNKDPWANLAGMSGVDLLDNMTDADADTLEKALLKEELDSNK